VCRASMLEEAAAGGRRLAARGSGWVASGVVRRERYIEAYSAREDGQVESGLLVVFLDGDDGAGAQRCDFLAHGSRPGALEVAVSAA
jgi:hypothetical protein